MKKKNILFIIALVVFVVIILFLIFNKSKEGSLIELNISNLEAKLENKDTFILCISSTTCSHCQDYKPKLSKIAKEYGLYIYYIDYDKYDYETFTNLISFSGSTPTTAFIKNGDESSTATRINGDVSYTKIVEKLKSNGFIN